MRIRLAAVVLLSIVIAGSGTGVTGPMVATTPSPAVAFNGNISG